MSTFDRIIKLSRQLYPKGRAFKMPFESDFEKLTQGLAASEQRAYDDALAIFNSILPDNTNFTANDATDWERRLGMVQNPSVPLADRKLAIKRKMNHPGTIPARQHYLYVEGQLRDAGFDVYVFENRFDDGFGGLETRDPLTVNGGIGGTIAQMGQFQMGQSQMGGGYTNKIVNYIDETFDANFNVGSNLRSTFFIGGTPVGQFADVSIDRKDEFRQLILKLKPTQAVGYLFINYV
jgi:hypothetical protein